MKFYVIAFDENWADEYCFNDMDSLLKFKNDHPDLTFGEVRHKPVLEWSK